MSCASSASPQTLMLDQLDVGVTSTIVVMICRIWDVNAATGRYLSTDFIVLDEKANLMHCTARGNIAHQFLRLKEGSIYSIKKFTVQPNKEDLCIFRYAPFMIEIDGDTVVRKVSVNSDGFDRYPFQFVEFDELETTNNKYLIDAFGYVTNVGRTTQQKSSSRTLDFYLANRTGQSIRVTLWGGLGDLLMEKRTRHVGLYLVVLTAVFVKLYNNRLYISSTSSTLIIDDLKIPFLHYLKSDDSGVELAKELLPVDDVTAKPGTLENLLMRARNRQHSPSTFLCVVLIDNVRTKRGLNYPSCGGEKCKKGNLDRKHNKFWCDSCNSIVEYPVIRYRLELEVSDEMTHVVVVKFDETAIVLVKYPAGSIAGTEVQDDEGPSLPVALANIIGSTHTLELKSQTYFEHANYESFTCWKVMEEVPLEEGGSSGTIAVVVVPEGVQKSLPTPPLVLTPSKQAEPKKTPPKYLEDSDAEQSFVGGGGSKGGEHGSSSMARKRKRLVLDESDCLSTLNSMCG